MGGRYPFLPEKIEALRESIRTTGFWGNIVARLKNGKPQIAYGHHRLQALRQEYSPDKLVQLIIKDLNDDDMLKIMARENMEQWGTSAAVDQETVRAVVEAYGKGTIELEPVPKKTPKTQIRDAPSFFFMDVGAQDPAHAYTGKTIAAYLGWYEDKAKSTLTTLQLIENKTMDAEYFTGLTTKQARAVNTEVKKASQEKLMPRKEAKRMGKDLTNKIRAANESGDAIDVKWTVRELEREIREKKAKKSASKERSRLSLEKRRTHDREVKIYTAALSDFKAAVVEARDVAAYGKFSPEAQRFVCKRHKELRDLLTRLEGEFDAQCK